MSNTEVDNTKLIQEFAQAGRTGRRNALPDILSQAHAAYGTGEITKALEKLQASGNHYIRSWIMLR